jgi:type II secretion system protein N
MAMRLPNPGPRVRKVLRYLGFAVVGLVTFVFAFQLTFPFERVKDKVTELLSEKYDVTIGGVERGWLPGRIYFKAVSLRTRPTKPEDFATTFYVEQLEVNLGLFALLRGTAAVKLDAKIGPGHIKGTIALSKDGTSIDLAGDDLPSASLPMREALGLPMSGKVRFAFELELPNEKSKTGKVAPSWPKAEGKAELACPSNCVVGDGKTKLKFSIKNQRQQAFAEGGIDFGKVNIDSLLANVEIKNGKVDITRFEAKSGDGELHIDFDMALNQDIQQSLVTGCLRFNTSPAFLKREPKTATAISATGAPLGPDNLFHIKLDGPLREVRRLGVVCGAAAGKTVDSPGGAPARPNLTVTPEPPATPPGPGAMGVLPPPPPPPAAPVPDGAGTGAVHVVPPSGPTGEMPTPAAPPAAAGTPPPAAPPAPVDPSSPIQPGGAIPPPPGVGQ